VLLSGICNAAERAAHERDNLQKFKEQFSQVK
jgi:hypothetical protein